MEPREVIKDYITNTGVSYAHFICNNHNVISPTHNGDIRATASWWCNLYKRECERLGIEFMYGKPDYSFLLNQSNQNSNSATSPSTNATSQAPSSSGTSSIYPSSSAPSTAISGLNKRKRNVYVSDLVNKNFPKLHQSNHFKIGTINITSKFEAYQEMCRNYCVTKFNHLKIEADINRIWALSGVVVISKSSLTDGSLDDFLKENKLKQLYDHLRNSLGDEDSYAESIVEKLDKLAQEFTLQRREDAFDTKDQLEQDIKDLQKETENKNVKKILRAIKSTVPYLRYFKKGHESEDRVSVIIKSFMINLFVEYNVEPHGSNRMDEENDKHNNVRCDFETDIMNGKGVDYTNVYGEHKPMSALKVKKDLAIDTYRVMMFGRNAIKNKKVPCVLAYQSIGTFLTFYAVFCLHDEFNVAIELETIFLPTTVSDFPLIKFSFIQLQNIVRIYRTYCFKDSSPFLFRTNTCQSVDYDLFLEMLSSDTKSEKKSVFDYRNPTAINKIITENMSRVGKNKLKIKKL